MRNHGEGEFDLDQTVYFPQTYVGLTLLLTPTLKRSRGLQLGGGLVEYKIIPSKKIIQFIGFFFINDGFTAEIVPI